MSTFQVYKYGYVERFMFHDWYDVGPLSADGRARRSPQPPPDHHAQLRADPKGGPRTELPGRAARDLAKLSTMILNMFRDSASDSGVISLCSIHTYCILYESKKPLHSIIH